MNMTDRMMNSQEQSAGSHWVDTLWFRILLITSLGLGIFFRVAGLGNKIYSHDEAHTSLRAAGYVGGNVFDGIWDGRDKTVGDIQKFLQPDEDKNITDTLSITALQPHQAPLFFLLSHFWMRLIGYSPAAMRGLAGLFGLLSIPGMYWFSRELFQSHRTAILSTAFFAVSPFHILFAQDARAYSLLTLAILLSSAALLWALRKDNVITWSIYSLTLILGMYSHQLFVLVAIVHGLYFIGMHVIRARKGYRNFLIASLIAILAYTPWLFLVITRWQQVLVRMDWINIQIPWFRYIQRWMLIFASPFIDFDFNSGNFIPYLLRVIILVLIAYALLFLVKHTPQQQWIFPLLIYMITAGALILPDLVQGGIRSISGRYFVPVSIVTIQVIAHFVVQKLDPTRLTSHMKWRLLVTLLIAGGILSDINSLRAETWWNKNLSRIQPELIHVINQDQSLLIVSGYNPTNLGDVLLLSLEVDSDVHFRMYQNPEDIEYPNTYDHVYWFPSSNEEVQEISVEKQLRVREILKDTLWQIDGTNE